MKTFIYLKLKNVYLMCVYVLMKQTFAMIPRRKELSQYENIHIFNIYTSVFNVSLCFDKTDVCYDAELSFIKQRFKALDLTIYSREKISYSHH